MFYQNLSNINILFRLGLDILLVWALLYGGLRLIRNNKRTVQIVKGLLSLMLIKVIADWLDLQAVSTLLDTFLNWGVILILVVLQPEIRQILERMGRTKTFFSSKVPEEQTRQMIDEIVQACREMSEHKTGALISIETGQSLQDYIQNGKEMDSPVSSYTLETIFQYGSPLHDGAVIIRGDKILSAASYLPNTAQDLPLKYGSRHRAAVGLSEINDAITIVVSEESGNISIASDGKLTQMSAEALKRYLEKKLISDEKDNLMVLETVKNIPSLITGREKFQDNPKDDRVVPIEVVDLTGKRSS